MLYNLNDYFTDPNASRQGNSSPEQEAVWEIQKWEGLGKAINNRPEWGREFIKQMELKKGSEYAKKLKEAANKERELRRENRKQFFTRARNAE